MNARAIRPYELTPEARIARAKRVIADAVDDLVEAKIAKGLTASEWVDQKSSPLGKTRHLRLVREKKLKGVREGTRVLVRRADINAYLERRAEAAPVVEDDEDVDAMMKAISGGGKR